MTTEIDLDEIERRLLRWDEDNPTLSISKAELHELLRLARGPVMPEDLERLGKGARYVADAMEKGYSPPSARRYLCDMADAIEALVRENERLREALTKIATRELADDNDRKIARAALGEGRGE